MSSFTGHVDHFARGRAIAAVVFVHVLLGAIILSGLSVSSVRRAVDQIVTINVDQPPPPTPPPPPPQPQRRAPKEDAGAPAKRENPTPIVAPPPVIPRPSPLPAAPVAGTGSATSSGAAASGSGTGAGGFGNGRGGGGDGGFTPARRISKIPDFAYRQLAATGISSGSVGVTILVNPDGSVSNCRVARSSGDRGIDGLMCNLTLRYVRFDPARDPSGRPIGQDVTFFPNWYRP